MFGGSAAHSLPPRSPGGSSLVDRVPRRQQTWNIDLADLELRECIGFGSGGVRVYKGLWKQVKEVAIKVVPRLPFDDGEMNALIKEMDVLMNLTPHSAVLQFYGVAEDTMSIKLVMEYCEKGSLMDLLKKARSSPLVAQQLTWLRRLDIALRIAEGMASLHIDNVLHRDLKSPNVLLTSKLDVKVADFGFSRFCEGDAASCCSVSAPTNLRWLAPETVDEPLPAEGAGGGGGSPLNANGAGGSAGGSGDGGGGGRGGMATVRWTKASDVYSYGVILWELMTFQFPFPDMDNIRLMVRFSRGEGLQLEVPPADEIPGSASFPALGQYVSLLQRCLEANPQDRPQSFKPIIEELRALKASALAWRRAERADSGSMGGGSFVSNAPSPVAVGQEAHVAAGQQEAARHSNVPARGAASDARGSPAPVSPAHASPVAAQHAMSPRSISPQQQQHAMSRRSISPQQQQHAMSRRSISPQQQQHAMSRHSISPQQQQHAMSRRSISPQQQQQYHAPVPPGGGISAMAAGLSQPNIGVSGAAATPAARQQRGSQGGGPLVYVDSTPSPFTRPGMGSDTPFGQGPNPTHASASRPPNQAHASAGQTGVTDSPFGTGSAPRGVTRGMGAAESSSSPGPMHHLTHADGGVTRRGGGAGGGGRPPEGDSARSVPISFFEYSRRATAELASGGTAGTPRSVEHSLSSFDLESSTAVLQQHLAAADTQRETYKPSIRKFLTWFKQVDKDGSGTIDHQELADGFVTDHLTASGGESGSNGSGSRQRDDRDSVLCKLVEEFNECDMNNDGLIDAAEFLVLAGRLLRSQLQRQPDGRPPFDLQLYEQESRDVLAQEEVGRPGGRSPRDSDVFYSLVREYVRWFRTFDKDHDGVISMMEVKHYISHASDSSSDMYQLMTEMYKRFREFDSDGDGYIDRHEYLHLCARLLTEEHRRQGLHLNEETCRYQLYYHAMSEKRDLGVEYNRILVQGTKAIGWPPLQVNPHGPVRAIMAEKAALVKGRRVGPGERFGNEEFRRVLELLAEELTQGGSTARSATARPGGY